MCRRVPYYCTLDSINFTDGLGKCQKIKLDKSRSPATGRPAVILYTIPSTPDGAQEPSRKKRKKKERNRSLSFKIRDRFAAWIRGERIRGSENGAPEKQAIHSGPELGTATLVPRASTSSTATTTHARPVKAKFPKRSPKKYVFELRPYKTIASE